MSWNSIRGVLQTIHLWTGLIVAIPLILIGLSGSALIVQREILIHSVPAATAQGERQSVAAIIAAAQPALPNLTAARVDLPASAGYPAAVLFPTNERPARTIAVYVDPVSLKVLGTAGVAPRGPMQSW
ncbi:MAG TPA: PepSY-associated TM helix domain-containing protein, partial [Stellaceae bacterium]|nr:PepSY-associated TM helix domain-containing protein [Stellaceae bacterium]